MGFAFVPLDTMQPHIDAGRLVPVQQDWWLSFPVNDLYYAADTSRRRWLW